MTAPLVSICIPTRNRCNSLRETLKDIGQQGYPALDILVSDNCSEDATEQVCRELMLTDPRIRYVRHPANIGLHGNHNFCIDSARGPFLCIFHDHDKHDRTIISEYVAFLAKYPTVGVVCSDWDLIDDNDRRLGIRAYRVSAVTAGRAYISDTIRSGRSSIGIPGAMVRTSALTGIRFGVDAPIGFGDFPLWFRLAETWDVGHISKTLWSWRQNRESHSARAIVAVADDYAHNIGRFCDEYLTRWPDDGRLVATWRGTLRKYLFWALAYEVALHFRRRDQGTRRAESRTLFEIMDYRLTGDEFDRALDEMKAYRSSPFQHATYAAVQLLIRLRLSGALGWLTQHQAAMRSWLRLE